MHVRVCSPDRSELVRNCNGPNYFELFRTLSCGLPCIVQSAENRSVVPNTTGFTHQFT